jgi:8-oxo-dGTP pyrophosphatase MutT (NUDIX family)
MHIVDAAFSAAGATDADVLKELVASHPAADDREAEAKRQMLAALEELEKPTDRDADPVHFTASAVVVGTRGTVLHRHRRLGRWLQPGGHIDAGETPAEAALRESTEETGLGVEHPAQGPMLIHLDVHDAAEGHTHLDVRYVIVAGDEDPKPGPGESPDARWFSWSQAYSIADPALIGALRTARAWSDENLGHEARSRG